jgi:hypothetical protein
MRRLVVGARWIPAHASTLRVSGMGACGGYGTGRWGTGTELVPPSVKSGWKDSGTALCRYSCVRDHLGVRCCSVGHSHQFRA